MSTDIQVVRFCKDTNITGISSIHFTKSQ
jgi:hypothetical protein